MNFLWDNFFRRDSAGQDILETLKRIYLFEPLTKKELRFVKATLHVRNYRPGEIVFRQGELGVGMYIILKGSIEIYVDSGLAEETPQNTYVTRLVSGDFLGELSLIEENSRRTATAIADEETTLIGFFKPDLLEIIDRQPATGVKVLYRLAEVLGRRLKETTLKVSELKRELHRMEQRPETKLE